MNDITTSLSIQPYTSVYLEDVKELINETIELCYPKWYCPEVVAFFKEYHSKEEILKRTHEGFWVLVFDGKFLVGSGAIIESYVSSVYVRSSLQGKGVGKQILDFLIKQAVLYKIEKLVLDATPGSVEFYKSCGFSILEEKIQWIDEKHPLPYTVMQKVF